MRKIFFVCLSSILFWGMLVTISGAASILTQTSQGNYPSNSLNGSQWSAFTSIMTTQHSITDAPNFENLADLLLHDAIWVDQEFGGSLTTTEVSSLNSYFTSTYTEALFILDSNWNADGYISNGENSAFAQNIVDWLSDSSFQKMVFIGENNSWNTWNQSILDVVGGAFNGECSNAVGSSSSTHALTNGVGYLENECGSTILTGFGSPDILFDNNMAAVYSSEDPGPDPVPEPSTILLLGSGLLGLGWYGRKRKKA